VGGEVAPERPSIPRSDSAETSIGVGIYSGVYGGARIQKGWKSRWVSGPSKGDAAPLHIKG
jgi:hypothetical protein